MPRQATWSEVTVPNSWSRSRATEAAGGGVAACAAVGASATRKLTLTEVGAATELSSDWPAGLLPHEPEWSQPQGPAPQQHELASANTCVAVRGGAHDCLPDRPNVEQSSARVVSRPASRIRAPFVRVAQGINDYNNDRLSRGSLPAGEEGDRTKRRSQYRRGNPATLGALSASEERVTPRRET